MTLTHGGGRTGGTRAAARGGGAGCRVSLTPAEQRQLLRWARSPETPPALAIRSRIILMASEEGPVVEIAEQLRVSPAAVLLWCRRFRQRGLTGLMGSESAPVRRSRPGVPPAATFALLGALFEAQSTGRRWTLRSLANAADTSVSTARRVLARFGLSAGSSVEDVGRAVEAVLRDLHAAGRRPAAASRRAPS